MEGSIVTLQWCMSIEYVLLRVLPNPCRLHHLGRYKRGCRRQFSSWVATCSRASMANSISYPRPLPFMKIWSVQERVGPHHWPDCIDIGDLI
jgi:hypothetical protein